MSGTKVIAALVFAAFAGVDAEASQPSGTQHGPWRVTSIGSLDGDGGNDSAVSLSQDYGQTEFTTGNRLEVRWDQERPITISIGVAECYAENDEFEQSYEVPTANALALPKRALAKRIEADFSTWLGQARLACREPKRLDAFKLKKLRPAVYDFIDRVRYFSQFGNGEGPGE